MAKFAEQLHLLFGLARFRSVNLKICNTKTSNYKNFKHYSNFEYENQQAAYFILICKKYKDLNFEYDTYKSFKRCLY